jgi:hypothetical protein
LTKKERIVVNTAWGYLRDHAKTPEQIAIKESLSEIIREDIKRRKRKLKGGLNHEN